MPVYKWLKDEHRLRKYLYVSYKSLNIAGRKTLAIKKEYL